MATVLQVLLLLLYQVRKLAHLNNLKWFCVMLCKLIFLLLLPAQKVSPFYEEWWFLVVIALVGLIFILLLIFILIIRGQSNKYTKKTDSGGLISQKH